MNPLPTLLIATLIVAAFGYCRLWTQLRHTRNDLQLAQQRYTDLCEESLQGMVIVRGDRTLYANPAALHICGLATIEDLQRHGGLLSLIPEWERPMVLHRQQNIFDGQEDQLDWVFSLQRPDGCAAHIRVLSKRILWNGATAEQMVLADDTERLHNIRELEHRSNHDALTGLPNRAFLMQYLARLTDPDNPSPGFGLLLIDVDRFRLVNDSLGHAGGDRFLRSLAQNLRHLLPRHCPLVRIGGDEFVVVVEANTDESADEIARLLLAHLREPLILGDQRLFVDLSMGIVKYPHDGGDPGILLGNADAAMYAAKHQQGSAFVFFDPELNCRAQALFELEQALRGAIENREFILYYQPKVDAQTRRISGFEALVRWNRPGVGIVNPGDFIPAAEHTGLILPLGDEVLRLACEQLVLWQKQFGHTLPVAINASAYQMRRVEFAEQVAGSLDHYRLPGALLQIEITETAAVDHLDSLLVTMEALRRVGVQVALDDFGTGYSSLTYLHSLPISTLKIDRSLIDPLPSPQAGAIAEAICTLGRALGHTVVAEGIERADQAEIMAQLGCSQFQGYFFGRPMDAKQATACLQTAFAS